MKCGMFISFEGIDGCGKSTQIWNLAKHISCKSKYNHILVTREPYKSQTIREILKRDNNPNSNAIELAILFSEDGRTHARELIEPSINKGNYVISDRYRFSTFAYQQAQGVSFEEILKLNKGLPIPDLTYIIDVSVDLSLNRMNLDKERIIENKFEKERDFLEKARQNFLNLPDKFKEANFCIINGSRSIDEIFNLEIKPIFENSLNQPRKNLYF